MQAVSTTTTKRGTVPMCLDRAWARHASCFFSSPPSSSFPLSLLPPHTQTPPNTQSQLLSLPLPDLIPLSLDAASPSSSSSSSLHNAYTTLDWDSLQLHPAFVEWHPEGGREGGKEGGRGSTAKGLFELLLAIKGQVTGYHVEKVREFLLEDSVRFEVEMLVREEGGRERGREGWLRVQATSLLNQIPHPSSFPYSFQGRSPGRRTIDPHNLRGARDPRPPPSLAPLLLLLLLPLLLRR